MISIKEYRQEDLSLIKRYLLILALCLILITGIFWLTNYLDKSATAELEGVRSQLDSVQSSINEIRSEQDTADRYLDAYMNLQTRGAVGAEDRLQMLELVAQIRARHDLFPITINIGEQAELTLPYENNADGTALPVNLRSSLVDLTIPLLHEEDLSRLLDDLLGSTNLLQPASCTITANSTGDRNLYYLDKHFTASCSLFWYTFDVAVAAEAQTR